MQTELITATECYFLIHQEVDGSIDEEAQELTQVFVEAYALH